MKKEACPDGTAFHSLTLPCGMRIVCAPSATDVAYCGIAVDAGTRDETADEGGMAHFCEHMTFKGTHRRRARHILKRMDSVGGDLNAYTGKEETVYYCAFLRKHFARAVDLLTDIVFDSTYPEEELVKEVEVVAEEIESCNDTPSELIFDEFENMIFDGHPLGRGILGETERLRTFTSGQMLRFARRLYIPERTVFFVYGRIEPETVFRTVERAMEKVESSCGGLSAWSHCVPQRAVPPAYRPQEITKDKDTHQAHVMLGTRAYAAGDKRRMSLYLLNNIMGGPAMNSRLNLELREKRGLVYMVESCSTAYTDTGLWSVYFGCAPDEAERCRDLVLTEMEKMVRAPLLPRQLEEAKRQIKGQIGVSYDCFENVALSMGKRFLHYHEARSIQSLYEDIDRLTVDDLHEVAVDLFQKDKLTTLIYR